MIPDIDRVTRPEYRTGLEDHSLDTIRSMRAECEQLENAASYARRFAQARLDLVAGARPETSTPESGTAESGTTTAFARPPQEMEPNSVADELIAELDRIAPPGSLSAMAEPGSVEVDNLVADLSAFEQSISAERKRLHEVIDALQAEVVRRYKHGEASVDSLLGSD